MKIQESAENYLESVLILQKQKGHVRSIDIVNYLDFSKPSVSVAMKNLRENGYIHMDDGYITLTEKGMEIAQTMYERHTVLSQWLISLGVDEKIAVEDACRMEHTMSTESFTAIKNFITQNQAWKKDNPDPHEDPGCLFFLFISFRSRRCLCKDPRLLSCRLQRSFSAPCNRRLQIRGSPSLLLPPSHEDR